MQDVTSIKEIPSISGRFSYSETQVRNGIIMADGDLASEIAEMLKHQETNGPLSDAKNWTVLHGDDLVFCEQAGPAYTALYFYTAGFFDCHFLRSNK